MKKILALPVLLAILFGCTHRITDFTLISTKNVDMSKASSFKRAQQRVNGEDRAQIIIFIPIGEANVKEAIDNAIEQIPGCVALVDGVLYTKFWYIPYIYGQSAAIVEGTPLIDPSLTLNNDVSMPDYTYIKLDRKGGISEFKTVTEAEFNELMAPIREGYDKKGIGDSRTMK